MRPSFLTFLLLLVVSAMVFACRSSDETLVRRVNGLLDEQRLEEAKKIVDEALRKKPKSADALFLSGWIKMVQGDDKGALTLFGRCLHDDPGYYGGHKGLGALYLRKNKPDLAEKEFSRAIELKPDSPMLYANLAQARTLQGNLEGAKIALEKGRMLSKGAADFDLLLAQNEVALGQSEQAITRLDSIGQRPLSSNHYRALMHCVRGTALVGSKVPQAVPKAKLQEAKDSLERCEREDPKGFRNQQMLEQVALLLKEPSR